MESEVFRSDTTVLRRWNSAIGWGLMAALLVMLGAFFWWDAADWVKTFTVALAAGILVVRVKTAEMAKAKEAPVQLDNQGLSVRAWGVGPVAWADIAGVRTSHGSWVVVDLTDPATCLARAKWLQRFFMRAFGAIGRGPFAIDAGFLEGTPQQVAASIRRWSEDSQ